MPVSVDVDDEMEQRERDDAAWPYASLLLFGFFGSGSPEGRRLARWTTVATVGVLVGAGGLVLGGASSGPARLALGALLPGMVVLMAVAYVRYLAALDELARLIQLQAFAVAYGFAMLMAAGLFALASVGEGPAVHGAWAAGMVAVAEVVRGVALAFFARRHE